VAYRSSNKIIIGIAYKTDFFVSHDIKFIMNKILVCKKTDFTNLNMLTNFKAVVTSYGGVLSHASIYCRELKIPCIVGAQNILTEIKTVIK
jgi:phosphohistidine swiveling domain-containing protein